jgi:hypothetical protein
MAHRVNAKFRPAFAAVITDLKSRGLRNDRLVVCGSEFGRTPVREVGGPAMAAHLLELKNAFPKTSRVL